MKSNFLTSLFAATLICAVSCKKTEISIPPAVAQFTSSETTLPYYVLNTPNSVLKIPVGISNVSDKDRTINFTVSSSTGAQEGVQYTIAGGKGIVIPAGEAVDSIELKGIFSALPTGRIDTLTFTISGGDVPISIDQPEIKVVMQRYCDVVLADLVGVYGNTMDGSYGPYPTRIMSTTPINATSAKIVVRNVYDYGFNDLEFTIDWSDPANFKVSLAAQNTGTDASIRFTGYGGNPLWIYPVPGVVGSFSSCSQTFKLVYRLGIPGIGYGGAEVTDMAR